MAGKNIFRLLHRLADASGSIEPNATVEFYLAGTSTPLQVYSDRAMTVTAGASVTADARGVVPERWVPMDRSVKLVYKDASGAIKDTRDYAITLSDPGDLADIADEMVIVAGIAPEVVTTADNAADIQSVAAALANPSLLGAFPVELPGGGPPDELQDWLGLIIRGAFFNVKDPKYGAVGDAVAGTPTDDSAAIQAAYDAAKAYVTATNMPALVYYPPALYRCEDDVECSSPLVYSAGEGPRASMLYFAVDGKGLRIGDASSPGTTVQSGNGVFNLGIRARTEMTTGDALHLDNCGSFYANNVQLIDHFGGLRVTGGIGIFLHQFNIFGGASAGTAAWSAVKPGSYFAKFEKASGGRLPAEVFIANCNWRRTDTTNYVENGVVINECDGIWFGGNFHVMGVDEALFRIEPGSGTSQLTGLIFDAMWLDNNCKVGIEVVGNTSGSWGAIVLDNVTCLRQTEATLRVSSASTGFEGFLVTGGVCYNPTIFADLAAGRKNIINSFRMAACVDYAVRVANGANVFIGGKSVFEDVAQGNSETPVGVQIESSATGRIEVDTSHFDLTSADVVNNSASATVRVWNNTTTKSKLISSAPAGVLAIPMVGTDFYVGGGLTISDIAGAQPERPLRLRFTGVSTLQHNGSTITLQPSLNVTTAAGDQFEFFRDTISSLWRERSRKRAAARTRAADENQWYPHAQNLAAGTPLTGSTTETTLATVSIPGGAMNLRGSIRVTLIVSMTSSANNKTCRVKYGGTTFRQAVFTTSQSAEVTCEFHNRNSETAQLGKASTVESGASSLAAVTASIDTTTAQDLLITGQLADGADSLTLEGYRIEILNQQS